jgi:hypothetical protein
MNSNKTLIMVLVLLVLLSGVTTAFAVTPWFEAKIFSIKENQKLTFIAGTVRQDGAGNWYAQNDSNHTPVGISQVLVNAETNRIRVVYDSTVKKVVTLTITPDDVLAEKGYIVSGSGVGLTAADFRVGRLVDMYGGVSYNPSKATWTMMYNNKEYTYTIEDRGNGTLRVHHANDKVGLIPVQLTARDGAYMPKLGLFSDIYFDVKFYDRTGNQVTVCDDKCNFLFSRSGYHIVNVSTEKFPLDGNFWVNGVMKVE